MSRSTVSFLKQTGLDIWLKGMHRQVKSQVVSSEERRNFKGHVGFGEKMIWLLFKCFDLEQFMKCLVEDFLGSLETGTRAGGRGWVERADERVVSYSKSRDEG